MTDRDTDGDWRAIGEADPYWGVWSDERFRQANLTDAGRQEFFASGETFVGWVLDTVRRHLTADFRPQRALDFGCGVGRLVLPLARRCQQVVGVDVSDGMLAECRRNAELGGMSNVQYVRGDDGLTGVDGRFDLITAFVVFQHIPPDRGQALFRRLVGLLNDGGVGALHVTFSDTHHGEAAYSGWPATGGPTAPPPPVPPPPGVWNGFGILAGAVQAWVRKRIARRPPPALPPPSGSEIRMYSYTLNPLLHALQSAGVRRTFVEFTEHAGHYGLLLFFVKNPADGYRA